MERHSLAYQQDHDPEIGAAPGLWGMFAISDLQLGALGDVTGLRVLELGCDAGQWSRALVGQAAAIVGLDLSEAQLSAARQAMRTIPYPAVALAEAARMLRTSGRLLFNVASPWRDVCYDDATGSLTTRMQRPFFTLDRRDEGNGAASYQLTYGGWIRALRQVGLIMDDLIEPRPDPGQRSSYLNLNPP